ncbi:MAG: hypothetical protein H7A19_20255, partial [Rhodanobacteraceae bacterium]|nr:hypothetical protein [Rhodanobacteraceae bacterium]
MQHESVAAGIIGPPAPAFGWCNPQSSAGVMTSPQSERHIELGGYAIAALAAILFSAKAILAKLLYRYSIDPITLMTLRLG